MTFSKLLNLKGLNSADKWGLANAVLRLGSPFLFFPVLVRSLPPQELGIWYLLLNVSTFVGTLESGVSATVSRAVGLLKGGARSIEKHGFVSGNHEEPNLEGIGRLIPTSRIMGLMLTLVILASVFLALPWLKAHFGSQLGDTHLISQLSIVLCLMAGATVLSGHAAGIVVGLDRQEIILSRNFVVGILQNLAGVAVLVCGGKLYALSCTFLGGSLMTWLWNEWSLHRCCRTDGIVVRTLHFDMDIFRALRPTWLRNSAVSLGAFFVMNTGTLVAALVLGLEEAARWGLSMQAIGTLNGVCQIGITSIIPTMSVLRGGDRLPELIDTFGKRLRVSLALYLLGGLVLVFAGNWMLGLIRAQTQFLPTGLLIGAVIVQILEFNHSAHGAIVLSANRNPFAIVSIFGGGGILILSYFLGSRLGLPGLVLGRGLVQACIVNWWPILLAARSLGFAHVSEYVKAVYGFKKTGIPR